MLDSSQTGGLANSRIDNETRILSRAKEPVIVSKGVAYWLDFQVKRQDGTLLQKDVDYVPLDLCATPTKLAGTPVYSGFQPLTQDTTLIVSYTIPVDFQSNSDLTGTIQTLFNVLTDPNRSAWWDNVINRPVLFNPTYHRHNMSESIGYEYLINTLDQLIRVMILGDEVGHDQLRKYIDDQLKNHFNSIIQEFRSVNNSTQETIGFTNARLNKLLTEVSALQNTLTNLKNYPTQYTTLSSAMPAANAASVASANTWQSALAF